jgi:hypothetical protein
LRRGLGGEGGEEWSFDGFGGGGRVGVVGVGILSGVIEAGIIDCWVRVIGVLCCGWVWGLLMRHLALGWHVTGSSIAVIGTIGVHE